MVMKRQNKYRYLKVLQGFFEDTWCDLIACETNDRKEVADFKESVRLYRENDPRPYRVIHRRILATEKFHA